MLSTDIAMAKQQTSERVTQVLIGLVSLLVGQGFVSGSYDVHPEAVTQAMTAQSVAHEMALARTNGLTQVAVRTAHHGLLEEFSLRPGGCFSVVVSATGRVPVSPLEIRDQAGQVVGTDPQISTEGYVRHASWCALRGGRFTVAIDGGTPLQVARFEGTPAPTLWPLARTQPTEAMAAMLRQEMQASRWEVVPEGQSRLTAWTHTTTAGATLLPDTPATRALLRASLVLSPGAALPSQTLAVTPPTLQRYAVAATAAAPADVAPERAATLTLLGDTLQLVAVLDVGAFHRRCVTLRVMPATATSEPLYRVDVPGWQVHAVARHEEVFTDRRCVTDPLAVYAVRADTNLSLRFALDADSGAEEPALTAAAWRGETASHSLFTRLQAACAVDASACMTLGFLGGSAIPMPLRPDAAAAFGRACRLDRAEGCARLAAVSRDAEASQRHLHRACALGMASACMLHGERARLGLDGVRFDVAAAMASYQRGCALGDADACHQRDTMQRLQLAP